MSRGPGQLQRRVLETLALYAKLGASLGWKWHQGKPYAAANYADDLSISAYERGHYVHVWMLLRDLQCSASELSRALKGLEAQGLVYRLNGSLDGVGDPFSVHRCCKFAALTTEGDEWLKRQQTHSGKVDAYAPVAAEMNQGGDH